ncbi:hypothetical protein QZH56_13700 [Streptomyces olivoreticuli]|uniref:hypothetical protein n=1 Tax=Streptomyces olivoreticuli TaxID=68246 RepID=UPI00265B4488|nr:hypothetical protein [Streptomyces olivoreticuli]WKK26547.1 hypothetical protein QZH56_13700 [Streptomyces olivoreticuli]
MSITPLSRASPSGAIRRVDGEGGHWSGRELQPLMGYEQWDRSDDVVARAVAACANSGRDPAEHFRGVARTPSAHGGHPVRDYRLAGTRAISWP